LVNPGDAARPRSSYGDLTGQWARETKEEQMATEQTAISGASRRESAAGRASAEDSLRERLLTGMPVTERRLEVAGIPTAVLEGGEGPSVIFLHGPGEFGAKWMRVIPDLVGTNRVIAPDLPGHGGSGVPDGALDAGRVLAWLDELIERTCDSAPVLVGHLLGGAIAARFASEYTDRISGLVLVGSLGLGKFRPSPLFAAALVRFMVRPSERSSDRLWQRCTVDLAGVQRQMGERWDAFEAYYVDRAREKSGKSALRSLMGSVGTPVIPDDELARIVVPTTLIWGRENTGVRLAVGEAASTRHGWPLQVIDHAGDDPPMEQPQAFLQALRPSLRRI
jgi:pimeloyl-ACP methyl ester carboxylesterase